MWWRQYLLTVKKRPIPGTKAAESSDAVPRIGGMEIPLFIMGDNQISEGVFASELEGVAGCRGAIVGRCNQYTYFRPEYAPRPF